MAVFDVPAGYRGMSARGEVGRAYLAVALGILAHFVWEILAGALRTQTAPEFGEWWALGARVVLALIVAAVSFTGIWKQLENADSRIRFFVAFSQGFAVDALASPVAPATLATGAGP